jgi:hypothetical protein
LLWSRNTSSLGALSSFPSLLPPLLLQVDQNFVKTLFGALGLVREYKNKGQTKRVGKGRAGREKKETRRRDQEKRRREGGGRRKK